MALALGRNEIGIKRTGQKANVPNNDIAKLMYYLRCVCTTVECNDAPEIQKFTNYNQWHRLSLEEQRQLFVLCYTLSPDVFNDQVFFQSDALCMDFSNEFYEISQVRSQLVAAQSIVIAGQTRRVNKIMTYRMSWMQENYFQPMQRQAKRFSKKERSKGCIIA